eukprot:1143634-Pelagomonas_calceolata.AAC.8
MSSWSVTRDRAAQLLWSCSQTRATAHAYALHARGLRLMLVVRRGLQACMFRLSLPCEPTMVSSQSRMGQGVLASARSNCPAG